MTNYGIATSRDGVNVQGASLNNTTFTTKYPLAKLDRTNTVSFQNINLTFLNDTAAPPLAGSNSVLVYSFAHGYKYIPSHWMMGSLTGGTNNYPYIEDEEALLSSITNGSQAILVIKTDSQNVYLFVNKTNLFGDGNPSISGVALSLRLYVFVEDLLGS